MMPGMSARPNRHRRRRAPRRAAGAAARWRPYVLGALVFLAVAGASGLAVQQALSGHADVTHDLGRPHHHAGGFRNTEPEVAPLTSAEWLRWHWQAARQRLPQAARSPTPAVAPRLDWIRANARAGAEMQPAVTWIGHATVLLQMGGLNLVTDPVFGDDVRLLPLLGPRRAHPAALQAAQLPPVDVVLISHDHRDHLDEQSVRALNRQPGRPPLFVVPLGLRAWLAERAITNVVELDWWQSHRIGALEIVLTPAQHGSGRGLGDDNQRLWGGFALLAPDLHAFYAGGSGYAPHFAQIHARFAERQGEAGFDLALLPIGGYEPGWYAERFQMTPAQAARAHLDLQARHSLGVRWGSFEIGAEPLDQPPLDLAQARRRYDIPDSRFFVMGIGETRTLPRRDAAE